MKYFIECMLRCIMALGGGTDKPMKTTGLPSTMKEVGIGLAGWLGLTIIFFISLLLFRKLGRMESGRAANFSMCICVALFIILIIIYFCI